MNWTWQELDGMVLTAIAQVTELQLTDCMYLFSMMYDLGYRIEELLDMRGWMLLANNDYLVPAQKRGNTKIAPHQYIPEPIKYQIAQTGRYRFTYDVKTYRGLFVKYGRAQEVYVGEKRATLHISRHAFIHRKSNEGLSNEQIKELLGVRNIQTIVDYLNTEYKREPYHKTFP